MDVSLNGIGFNGISHGISWGHFGESFSGLLQALALCALFSTVKAGSAEHIPRRAAKKKAQESLSNSHASQSPKEIDVSSFLARIDRIYCLVVELQYSSFSIVLLLVMLLFDQWWMICGV